VCGVDVEQRGSPLAKIEAHESRTLNLKASKQEVVAFFNDPHAINAKMADVEVFEVGADGRAHWTIKEIGARGVSYQARYSVVYVTGEDWIRWDTDSGNMEIHGRADFRSLGERLTEVRYDERVAPDLPIPRLMAKLFKPIVAREVRKGIHTFLDRVSQEFGS